MSKKNRHGFRLTQLFKDPEVQTNSLYPTGKKNPRKPLTQKEYEKRKKRKKK